MFLFFFLFWIKYLLVWKYCDKKDMLILYKTWEQQGDLLILTGESIGNGQTISFSDTLTIKKATQNELTIQDRNIKKTYTRQK